MRHGDGRAAAHSFSIKARSRRLYVAVTGSQNGYTRRIHREGAKHAEFLDDAKKKL